MNTPIKFHTSCKLCTRRVAEHPPLNIPIIGDPVRFREQEFIEFIQAFCKWDPNEDEGPAPGDDDGVVDVEAAS